MSSEVKPTKGDKPVMKPSNTPRKELLAENATTNSAKGKGKLLIVESPAKARTIKKLLGREYTIMATVGHIRDLKKGRGKKSFGIDLENGYEPQYAIIPAKMKTVNELKTASKKAADIYLAPDPDREGEAIAWHLKEALSLSDEQAKRITYQSVTKKAVDEALSNPRPIDMKLVGAQKGRRVLDRLVGFTLSPFLWEKVAKNLSAGRVQSVAVRLIVEREREIDAFIPEEFWKINATLHAEIGDSTPFSASLISWKGEKFALGGRFSSSEESAREVETALRSASYRVSNVTNKNTSSKPPAPFITSTLQQAASGQLRFGTRRTMQIAQKLYEGINLQDGAVGLITYIRTDSSRLDPDALIDIRNWIGAHYPQYLPEDPREYGPKAKGGVKSQDAHEAIRPTSVELTPERARPYLTDEQYRLYELIWRRTVASQMHDARYTVTTISVEAAQGILEAKGRVTLFDGFTVFTPESKKAREDFQSLPALKGGEKVSLDDLNAEQNWTKPKARYTEASLVRMLESEGIGRPSTYASIIQTIRERGYVCLEKRAFHASELGMAVNDILLREFPTIMEYQFTADMEANLDAVEDGKVDWHKLVDDFYQPFIKRVEEAIELAEPLKGKKWEGNERCPICGGTLILRYSKSGTFLGCGNYPECKGLMPLPNEDSDESETDDEPVNCPTCGKPMLLKSSRYGQFYACSGYPECRSTASLDADGKPVFLPDLTMDCDECGTAMQIKSRRRGPAMVCPNQDCKRELPVRNDEIISLPRANGAKCDKCGSPMIVRLSRRGPFLACTGFPQCRNAKNLVDTTKDKQA